MDQNYNNSVMVYWDLYAFLDHVNKVQGVIYFRGRKIMHEVEKHSKQQQQKRLHGGLVLDMILVSSTEQPFM